MSSAKETILNLFEEASDWSVVGLTQKTGVTKQLVHRILKKLVDERKVERLGLPPKTIYRKIHTPKTLPTSNPFSEKECDYLKKTFLMISETGEYLEGWLGFESWCNKRKLPVRKTFEEFVKTKQKCNQYYNPQNIIDGTEKIIHTKGYEAIYLDKLFYIDFYAIERFGKTKLGTILHYAKQGQNKFLMSLLLNEIKNKIEQFVNQYKIDAIGYIPPTIKRELQLMQYIKNGMRLNVPLINIQKINGEIPVPQKSLQKLEERINNANNSFTIREENNYNNVLLVDDAVGSGATLNQIAKKIKNKGVAKSVIGLAIVGSFKGFDVITDV